MSTGLKHPQLKGDFSCGICRHKFCHTTSLNRHMKQKHGGDQKCMLCEQRIEEGQTVQNHMLDAHGIQKIHNCGCCGWSFRTRPELNVHRKSMEQTGQPGETRPISMGAAAPGSLAQSSPSEAGMETLEALLKNLIAADPAVVNIMEQQLQTSLFNMQMNDDFKENNVENEAVETPTASGSAAREVLVEAGFPLAEKEVVRESPSVNRKRKRIDNVLEKLRKKIPP